jgi:hypothetical protein
MTRENPSIVAFKAWVFPSLVSILGMMIWHDVNEVKQDVKLLMAQSNIDKTRIDNLERLVYKQQNGVSSSNPPYKLPSQVNMLEMVAVLKEDYLDSI